MLFDDPSSSSPDHGDARRHGSTRLLSRPAAHEQLGVAAPRPEPQRPADRRPSARSCDPRLIEGAGTPDQEALHMTEIAAAVVRELYDSGREVRFAFVPTRKRVAVLLCDVDGGVLTRLTPARALEIATGETIPGARRR
jgi:hypothetical protein